MATTDLKFWDGSAWVSVGSVAGDLIRLPVAAADGKSQVNGADGLISIENTTPGGEAGMIFVTANDGTRWRTNVEEGLAAGQMTFYNAANEASLHNETKRRRNTLSKAGQITAAALRQRRALFEH